MTAPPEPSPFSRRALGWVLGVSITSFACALLLGVFGGELGGGVPSAGADSFSRSALGHHAFVELLRAAGVPVTVSRHDSGLKASGGALLVVLEPVVPAESDDPRRAALAEMASQVYTLLVALPKWEGEPDPSAPGRIAAARLRPVAEAEEVLRLLGVEELAVVRSPPAAFSANLFERAPTIAAPVQWLASPEVTPLVAAGDRILLGETWTADPDGGETRVIVLSDPDLLENHGIGDGDNAAFALAMVDSLRGALDGSAGAVILDETLHGFALEPTLWRELFDFPLVLPLSQAILTLLVLLWAAMGRFGAPLPAGPALGPGKAALIANIAELLRYGGHTGHTLSRYFATTVQDLARRLHAPPSVPPGELGAWLARVGAARGVSTDVARLEAEVAAAAASPRAPRWRVAFLAERIHHFRQEMLDGSGTHPAG